MVFKKLYFLLVLYLQNSLGMRIGTEEMTVVEDVIGTYELESLKSLIINSTYNITQSIKSFNVKENRKQHDEFEDKTLVLMKTINDTAEKSNIMRTLSNIKLFMENQSHKFQNFLKRSTLASQLIIANDCSDLYNMNFNTSGVYWLQKFGLRVLCDMETDGGGWLIIQKRTKSSEQVDFGQDWNTYKMGFGDLNTEFWIGNDILHMVTNQKRYEMLIEMNDYENGSFYAMVGSEDSLYELDIGNYTGNASDSFTYHHGRPFSTNDKDHDNFEDGNCANYFSGGWWYDRSERAR
ncbi:Techylectin-5A [Armadillidium vulgare]|nr:Techylectin-5A [Armadillidium vulgare]